MSRVLILVIQLVLETVLVLVVNMFAVDELSMKLICLMLFLVYQIVFGYFKQLEE